MSGVAREAVAVCIDIVTQTGVPYLTHSTSIMQVAAHNPEEQTGAESKQSEATRQTAFTVPSPIATQVPLVSGVAREAVAVCIDIVTQTGVPYRLQSTSIAQVAHNPEEQTGAESEQSEATRQTAFTVPSPTATQVPLVSGVAREAVAVCIDIVTQTGVPYLTHSTSIMQLVAHNPEVQIGAESEQSEATRQTSFTIPLPIATQVPLVSGVAALAVAVSIDIVTQTGK